MPKNFGSISDAKDITTKEYVDALVKVFTITEDIVTVTTDATKGVAPYSTSYGYTNITIDEDAGIEFVDGGLYTFIIDTTMVVNSTYRNVRVRIGDSGDWHPVMGDSSILSGSSYFTKSQSRLYIYKNTYRSEGAFHLLTDSNTTYSYLTNTISAGGMTIDENGYGARYSLAFPTTPLYDSNGVVGDERFSSLVTTSSTSTSKAVVTPKSGKFYIDRHPQLIYSANIPANTDSANATYQNWYGTDLRYTCNISSTYLTVNNRAFLYLKNFNITDYSFVADATIGNIVSLDKLSTRFPSTVTGDIYLYFLGWTSSTWYQLSPNFQDNNRIYRYTPSTGELVEVLGVKDIDVLTRDNTEAFTPTSNYNPATKKYVDDTVGNANVDATAIIRDSSKNSVGVLSPLDTCIVGNNGNRLMFLDGSLITVEYSRDGGTTWVDSELDNSAKTALVSGLGDVNNFYFGGKFTPTDSDLPTINDKLRISINLGHSSDGMSPYFQPNSLYVWCTRAGHAIRLDKLEISTKDTPDTWVVRRENVDVDGWSGPNMINFSPFPFGGSPNQTYNYYNMRMTFGYKSMTTNANYVKNKAAVYQIGLFGPTVWAPTNTMMSTNHMYSYDVFQNVTFPAKVKSESLEVGTTTLTGADAANLKSLLGNVLTKSNTTAFTPTSDYHPATKKYVDDSATDVQINGTSITEDGVANIPNLLYLDENGNIRVKDAPTSTQWTGAVGIYTNGNIILSSLSQSIIDNRLASTPQFLTGGLLDYAVKAAMTDGKGAAWTEAEQKAAKKRIGIPDNIVELFDLEASESASTDDTVVLMVSHTASEIDDLSGNTLLLFNGSIITNVYYDSDTDTINIRTQLYELTVNSDKVVTSIGMVESEYSNVIDLTGKTYDEAWNIIYGSDGKGSSAMYKYTVGNKVYLSLGDWSKYGEHVPTFFDISNYDGDLGKYLRITALEIDDDEENGYKTYDYTPLMSRDVLTKDNESEYTPTSDYHPATKKYVDEHSGGGTPTDVQINGTSITENGVANIPIGSYTTFGAFKPYLGKSDYGIAADSNGAFISKALNSEIDSRSNGYKPIVPNSLDYAVKSAMCDGKGAAWSDTEKSAAKTRMGITDVTDSHINDLIDAKIGQIDTALQNLLGGDE